MKILILTQYFPPEVGAPQNRLFELAVRLQEKGADITVMTAMPNYPEMKIHAEYRRKFYAFEEMQGLKVHRSWIYVTTSKGIFKRLLNYFSFVKTSFWVALFKTGKCDYILCESPPLFLGITAYLLKLFKGAKLIFNVSDLWPESAEKLGLVTNKFFLKSATKLEEFLYKKSTLITGQTQGICANISARFPEKKVYWLPNGVDLNFFSLEGNSSDWRTKQGFEADDLVLLYAGIIGHAQGLELILRVADELRAYPKIKFVLLGSGPEKEKLLALKKELQVEQVYFLDGVGKKEMPAIVTACDIALVPLKRLDLFKGAIPSKIFENLALKKPLLLGVEGEAKDLFIDQGKCGLFFIPEDVDDLKKQILIYYDNPKLIAEHGEHGYAYVKEHFTRDRIAFSFWEYLNNLDRHAQ